jgi:hypothetical protein
MSFFHRLRERIHTDIRTALMVSGFLFAITLFFCRVQSTATVS